MINLKLLSDLWSTLLRQYVLELNVELLLLLNEDILLRDLLCLRNQTLLQTLDLLNKLIGLWVCALQLAPSVNIKGLLELISEELCLLLLLKVLLLKEEYLSAEIWNAGCFVL